jgi:hypothetical protein
MITEPRSDSEPWKEALPSRPSFKFHHPDAPGTQEFSKCHKPPQTTLFSQSRTSLGGLDVLT